MSDSAVEPGLAGGDGAPDAAARGAILRREGLYVQLISKWRGQRKEGFPGSGQLSALGLVGYAALTMAIGPWLFAAIWKS